MQFVMLKYHDFWGKSRDFGMFGGFHKRRERVGKLGFPFVHSLREGALGGPTKFSENWVGRGLATAASQKFI
jgi:hypothetical protein